ncbi:carboxypeptidase-like regulatory domain-containing protein [Serinicoccus kebangsaanensis]|uniref:carboxypeptidase-like regulatory domain-containing protein n=1 Tax=Serinicoccus kebangsaanensis TaxID=2602069 RepID=UPI00192DB7BE|nr:carboxypeptidase-like regulatory domain-containing protein [Serinicoccus kebangsaanensis]
MTGRIRGIVLDASGSPVPDARVALEAGPVPVPDVALLSDGDGQFWLDVPQPGEYVVAAHADDGSGRCTVTVPGGGVVRIVLGR